MFPSFVVWSCRCCCGSGQGPMLQWWKQKLLTVLMYWAKMPGIPVIIYINMYVYIFKLNNLHGYWTKKTLCKNHPILQRFLNIKKSTFRTDRITRTSWWTSSEALELIPNLPSVARVELLVKGCGGDRWQAESPWVKSTWGGYSWVAIQLRLSCDSPFQIWQCDLHTFS